MVLTVRLRRQNEKKTFYPDSEFQAGLETESKGKETDFLRKFNFHSQQNKVIP